MQCVKCFPDDNIPSGQFPLERETISESAQTTEGSNSSEHDADDNAESVDEPAHDEPDLDEQLPCPIPDQDKIAPRKHLKKYHSSRLILRKVILF